MNIHDAYPGKWLKASDLGDEDHAVTIESVKLESVGQGEQAQQKLVLKFHEFTKPLVCNLTNGKAIAKLVGSEDTDQWPGKRITLWVNPDVQFGSEIVSAIRVRGKAPAKAATTATLVGPQWTVAQAVLAAEEVGVSRDDLRKLLADAGYKGWNPSLTGWLQKVLAGMSQPMESLDDISLDEV